LIFQFEFAKLKAVIGQEDCLVLNVYVPKADPENPGPLPVMVFIHGGGFFLGSGSNRLYGPERFMDHGVASSFSAKLKPSPLSNEAILVWLS
jgi:carboxylesterase type B